MPECRLGKPVYCLRRIWNHKQGDIPHVSSSGDVPGTDEFNDEIDVHIIEAPKGRTEARVHKACRLKHNGAGAARAAKLAATSLAEMERRSSCRPFRSIRPDHGRCQRGQLR